MRAARQVHEAGAARHHGERLAVQQAARGSGQRQQVDDDLRGRQHRRQRGRSGVGGDAVQRLRMGAPAAHAIAVGGQALRGGAAHLAQAEDGHAHLVGTPLRLWAPIGALLLAGISEEAAVQREHCPQRGLCHRRVHRWVHHARQRHLGGQAWVGQQAIDAGPQRLHRPQPGQVAQGIGRWVRDQRHVDVFVGHVGHRRAVPHQPLTGQRRLQFRPPGSPFPGREIGRDEDRHGSAIRHGARGQALQRELHGQRADRGAVAVELQQLDLGHHTRADTRADSEATARRRQPDRADRLARCRAARPGDAGDGHRQVGM